MNKVKLSENITRWTLWNNWVHSSLTASKGSKNIYGPLTNFNLLFLISSQRGPSHWTVSLLGLSVDSVSCWRKVWLNGELWWSLFKDRPSRVPSITKRHHANRLVELTFGGIRLELIRLLGPIMRFYADTANVKRFATVCGSRLTHATPVRFHPTLWSDVQRWELAIVDPETNFYSIRENWIKGHMCDLVFHYNIVQCNKSRIL